ncbi:F-box/kelch-repeat protein At3g06240-like [Rutidosis leptorrhynchoides]|uniref:F-box/kelch-repeat protein At3g06240-like n=1 Tax=Rutidosis leptorrhynchoides TaxID=125765 RepID=UPI003A9A20F0
MEESLMKLSKFEGQLPHDLVFKILERLSFKSMLKAKSVCKQWRDVVSDPSFIEAHLSKSYSLGRIRYIHGAPMMKSVGLDDQETRYEHTIPTTEFSRYVEILGSCNGLILLGDGDRSYFLWNPSTRLLRSFTGRFLFRGEFRHFALGYDSTTRAYKVVRIVRVHSHKVYDRFKAPSYEKSVYDVTSAHVYSCKTNSWKKIEHFPYVIFEDAQGVTMNGYPHWIVFWDHFVEYKDKVIVVIVYFDLVEEKFKELPKPSWLVESSSYSFGSFEGKLCFIHYTTVRQREIREIWVMEKHGESWINVSSKINIKRVILRGWSSGHPYANYSREKPFIGAQYVESLVSPYAGNDMAG